MTAAFVGQAFEVVAFIATLVIACVLLDVAWCREQVKKDLASKACAPIHVRWHPYPFGYWAGSYCRPFQARFVDPTGCIQSARCKVLPLSRLVVWVSDEVEYLNKRLPNFVRVGFAVLGICLCYFGLQQLSNGSLTVPAWLTRRGRSFQVQGWSLHFLAGASFCGAAHLFTEALYHQTSKNKERIWNLVARTTALIGWFLLWSSLVALFAR